MERWIDCENCGKFGWMDVVLDIPDSENSGWADYDCIFCGQRNSVQYDPENMPGLSTLAYKNRVAAARA